MSEVDAQQDLFPPFSDLETSLGAACSVKSVTARLRLQVYQLVASSRDGMTCWEVEQATGRSHQSISARLWELEGLDLVHRPGNRRKTGSGRPAKVYYAGAGT